MSRRVASLRNLEVAVSRDISSSYDSVKLVADNINSVIKVARSILEGLNYLGGHKTPPATRIDGTAIQDSDYYYNSDDDSINYYSERTGLWHKVDAQAAIDAANATEANLAQTTLDAEATAADLVQTNEDQLQVAQDAATTASNANQAALDKVQTGEDRIQTTSDREQTGLDVTAASEFASNAGTSEDNAILAAQEAVAAAALAAEISATPGQDSILITLSSSNGVAFKNNTGQNKSLTANVYIGGVLTTGDYKYTWYAGGALAYVDSIGSYISTSPGGGVFPADGTNVETGLNFKTIIIDPSDVEFNSNLNLTCSVSNI